MWVQGGVLGTPHEILLLAEDNVERYSIYRNLITYLMFLSSPRNCHSTFLVSGNLLALVNISNFATGDLTLYLSVG